MPRASCIHGKVLVGSGDNTARVVLASDMGEPTPEPLMSHKAAVMTDVPEGAVIGVVIGIR